MGSLYTKEVKQYITGQNWPKGMVISIEEHPEFLRLVMFRDNLNKLEAADKLHVAQVINTAFAKLRGEGIPIYTEVKKGDGFE